jgi:hypothetical protein
MTASEKLLALAAERANAPEHMRELLALVIDRGTHAEISKINREIGESVYQWSYRRRNSRLFKASQLESLKLDHELAVRDEKLAQRLGQPSDYERLLREYVELKLHLHQLRKSMTYPYDAYYEREGDWSGVIARCAELKEEIKAMRKERTFAAWGGLEPAPKPTDFDKPLLYAMEDHECSFPVYGDEEASCPFAGENWFMGRAYCKPHFHEMRKATKRARRYRKYENKLWRRTGEKFGIWSVEPLKPSGEEPVGQALAEEVASGFSGEFAETPPTAREMIRRILENNS